MLLLIFIDIILSWLSIFWIQLRPKFLSDIIEPLYAFVRKYISTTLWPIDFTPIIVIFSIRILQIIILLFFPEIGWLIQLYSGGSF